MATVFTVKQLQEVLHLFNGSLTLKKERTRKPIQSYLISLVNISVQQRNFEPQMT